MGHRLREELTRVFLRSVDSGVEALISRGFVRLRPVASRSLVLVVVAASGSGDVVTRTVKDCR